jgi:hypothetical protein
MDAGRIDGHGEEKCEKLTEFAELTEVSGLAEFSKNVPALLF